MGSNAIAIDKPTFGLVGRWWVLGLRGVLACVFGVITLALPGVTMTSLVLWFAIYALVDGVVAIIASVRALERKERWGLILLEGMADILAAAVTFFLPGLTVFAFVGVLAGWVIATGILRISGAFGVSSGQARWWFVLGGVASIIYGGLLIIAPLLGAIILTWWLGVYAILYGCSLLMLVYRMCSARTSPAAAGLPQ